MSSFQKIFLQENASNAPRAYLAAFGKHPGWNDHIDDLGLETESLALAKQRIYLEGISSQIDSGAWEKLDKGHRLEGFDHLFFWQRGENSLLGCLVSSSDGKGRTRYPMILCAEFVGIPVKRVLGELRGVVEEAMKTSRAAATAAAVTSIVTQAREQLRRLTGQAPGAATAGQTQGFAGLVNQPALGSKNEGLLRILYQIKNHLAPWAPGAGSDKAEFAAPAVLLRVPQVISAPEKGLSTWAEAIASQLDHDAPRLLIWPRAGDWVDVIVGEPAPADFFGLRANTRALPCASEVPYEMDEAFRAEANSLLTAVPGSDTAKTIFGASVGALPGLNLAQRAASASQAAGERMQQQFQDLRTRVVGNRKRWMVWAAVTVVAFAIVVVAFRYFARGRTAVSAAPRGPAANVRATPAAMDVTAAWKALCLAHYNWAGGFQAALNDAKRRESWELDPDLRSAVVQRLSPGAAGRIELDPREISGAKGTAQALRNEPPASLSSPDVAQKVNAAAQTVAELEKIIVGWPALRRVREHRDKLVQQGWAKAVAGVQLPAALVLDSDLAASVDRVLGQATQLARAVERSDALLPEFQRLRESGDPLIERAARSLVESLAAAATLVELTTLLQGMQTELKPAIAVLTGDWGSGRIDRARFLRERGEAWAQGLAPDAVLKKWLEDVSVYVVANDEAASLPDADWQNALGDLQRTRTVLATIVPAAEVEPFAQRLAAIEKQWADLRSAPAVKKELAARSETARGLVANLRALGGEMSGEVARRADPVSWERRLRGIRIAESAVVESEWQRQRDALLRAQEMEALKADISRFLAAQGRAERVEKFLGQLAAAAALPETISAEEVSDETIGRDLRTRLHVVREATLAKLIEMVVWNDGLPGETAEEFWQKLPVRAVVADYVKAYGDLRGFGTDLSRIVAQLDEGCAWQDQAGKLFAQWQAHGIAAADYDSLPRLGEIVRRTAGLQRLATTTDRAALTTAARGELLAEGVTAWRRLGELPDWLRDAADLATEQQISAALQQRGNRDIKNPTHRAAFQSEIATHGRTRWNAALARATADADFTRLLGAMESFGVSESELGTAQRYNLLLHRLRSRSWSSLPKDQGRLARDEAVSDLRGVPGADATAVRAVIEQLQKVDFDEVQVDFAAEGPAKSGWTLQSATNPNHLVYVWNGPIQRVHRLEFVMVPLPDGQNAYLGTTEMPVQLFIDWVEHRQMWKSVLEAEKTMFDDFDKSDPRRGPRSYLVRRDPAFEKWRFVRDVVHWRTAILERYPVGETMVPPTEQTPLNYVSFTAAELFARDLNCRLPTELEWLAGLALESVADAGQPTGRELPANANVRDLRWRKQHEFQSQPAQRDKCWPDSDIFLPRDLPVGYGREETARAAIERDDGFLWFADVRAGPARQVWHLVGNVAEFVTNGKGQVGVIGGSALSPPEMRWDKLYEVDQRHAQSGFSDVGFRPAFTIGKLSGGAKIQSILASARFQPAVK